MRDTLLIIDGHSMAFRAFYALKPENFVTKTGQHTNAIYGFLRTLVNAIEDEEPTKVAVAFDVSRKTFRTQIYDHYKEGRRETPPEFRGQIDFIRQILGAMGITVLSKEGYEADDILATLAYQGATAGMRVMLASGDRDSYQTINENVTVLYPGSKGGFVHMTPEAVAEKYGVPPQRYPELAAIVGEKSDNLPGVPLIGDKIAAQLLTQFDGLDNLLARADEVKGKRGESLRAHADLVRRNRQINHLLTDVELDVTVDDLSFGALDAGQLFALFDTLEIGEGMRSAVTAVCKGADTLHAPGHIDFDFDADLDIDVVTSQTDIADWLGQASIDAIHYQGVGAPAQGRVDYLYLYAGGRVLVIDSAQMTPAQESSLILILKNAADAVVHDAKALAHAMSAQGWQMPWPSRDVQLAAYLAHPDSKSTLRDLLERSFGVARDAKEPDALFDILFGDEVPESIVHAARTVRALPTLWHHLNAQLEEAGQTSLLTDVEVPVARVLKTMEDIGIAVDMDAMRAQSYELGKEVEQAREAALEVIGEDVNLSSPKQLQRILFEVLNLPKTKKTKTGYTTNAQALSELRERTRTTQGPGFVFLDNLLIHRERIKLKQMLDSLIACVGDDGRIHSTFSQVVAATGRLASSEPNLQNIPARTPDGLRIRSVFVPGPGYESLMSVDYSQIEMRIMAHLSNDEGLIAAFASGEDLHRTMASMVFGVPVADVTPEQRSRIKATSYGLAYGLSAFGLSQQLKISMHDANSLRERYFERFGGVRDYLESVVTRARAFGYTETMFSRRRYLPDLLSEDRVRREMAERAALNAPIQGSAADIIKIAMVNVVDALADAGLKSRVLLQIHDELVLEVAAGEAALVEQIVRREMSSPVQMNVALDVAVGVGDNWMTAAH